MTILDPTECPDSPTRRYDSTFANTMPMRRSTRVVRKPKYYVDEIINDQVADEMVTSSDQSDGEWNEIDSDDGKPRKKVKLSRCSTSTEMNTTTSSTSSGQQQGSSSKSLSTRRNSTNLTLRRSSLVNSPSDHQDEDYILRRERNNISVRKSREKLREATKAAVKCIDELTKEKNQLAKDQEVLDKEISLLKQLIFHTFSPQTTTSCQDESGQLSNSTQEEHSYSSKPIESKPQVIDLSGLRFFDEMLNAM